jgi:hypothetical protein
MSWMYQPMMPSTASAPVAGTGFKSLLGVGLSLLVAAWTVLIARFE